jgi:hypothetical protein
MIHRRSSVLLFPAVLLAAAAGCGSGTLVPSSGGSGGTPAPEPAPAESPAPPAAEPAPAGAPAPAPTPVTSTAPAPDTTGAPPTATAYVPYGGGTGVQIRRIGQYSQSGITTPERLVIADDSTYARFWSELAVGADRPAVDFTRDVVVAVAGGQRSTGGYSIAVDRALRSGSAVTVEVVQTTPAAGCVMTQALTQPADVVVLAAADARSWSFRERSVEQGCG